MYPIRNTIAMKPTTYTATVDTTLIPITRKEINTIIANTPTPINIFFIITAND